MARMRFYATEKIGQRRELTPEGFLICYDVPAARIGTMQYGPGEVPIEPGPEGITYIAREADEVFRDETLASMQGKPLTNDHPSEDVTPLTWRGLAIGSVMNPRRGSGDLSDLMLVDILVTDKSGIDLVTSGKVEVSCGYDADYVETGPGEGKQTNIIYNHLALVERGRCGPRCAIGDKLSEVVMAKSTKKRFSVLDFATRLLTATADERSELINEAKAEDEQAELTEPGSAVHIHLGSDPQPVGVGDEGMPDLKAHIESNEKEHQEFRDAIAALREEIGEMKKAKDAAIVEDPAKDDAYDEDMPADVTDEDLSEELEESEEKAKDARKSKDSAVFLNAHRRAVAQAEIVSPGAPAKTFDAAAKPSATVRQIHEIRVAALAAAAKDPALAGVIGSRTLEPGKISFRDAKTLFSAAVAVRKSIVSAPARDVKTPVAGAKVPGSVAELNARNAEYWAKQ